ncbi:hypothetical protein BH23ACT9_BH23ACT9_01390 [soil metagenome]
MSDQPPPQSPRDPESPPPPAWVSDPVGEGGGWGTPPGQPGYGQHGQPGSGQPQGQPGYGQPPFAPGGPSSPQYPPAPPQPGQVPPGAPEQPLHSLLPGSGGPAPVPYGAHQLPHAASAGPQDGARVATWFTVMVALIVVLCLLGALAISAGS